MANGGAEQSLAIALPNGEEGDFKLKVDEFFNDDFFAIATHAGACIVPTGLNVGLGLGNALPLAR